MTDLSEWLDAVKLRDEAIKTCLLYTLDMGDTSLERGQRPQIMTCVKDAYGNPYIPGSSLKGALRTILAAAKILDDEDLRANIRQDLTQNLPVSQSRNRYLAATAANAEVKIFRTLKREETKASDAVNDTLQGLIVGDSAPITDRQALTLAQKIDRHTDGREKSLNLLREALRPGTKIEFPLTIDESRCPFSVGDILEAAYKFTEQYNDNFLTKFKGLDRIRADVPQILLGGGAGFVSKTLVYPTLGKAGVAATANIFAKTVKTKKPDEHKHRDDVKLGASPHIVKCTHYKGKTLQMGLCEFAIE